MLSCRQYVYSTSRSEKNKNKMQRLLRCFGGAGYEAELPSAGAQEPAADAEVAMRKSSDLHILVLDGPAEDARDNNADRYRKAGTGIRAGKVHRSVDRGPSLDRCQRKSSVGVSDVDGTFFASSASVLSSGRQQSSRRASQDYWEKIRSFDVARPQCSELLSGLSRVKHLGTGGFASVFKARWRHVSLFMAPISSPAQC